MAQAVDGALRLAFDPVALKQVSSAAVAFALRHQGAGRRTCERLLALLAEGGLEPGRTLSLGVLLGQQGVDRL